MGIDTGHGGTPRAGTHSPGSGWSNHGDVVADIKGDRLPHLSRCRVAEDRRSDRTPRPDGSPRLEISHHPHEAFVLVVLVMAMKQRGTRVVGDAWEVAH